MEIDSSAFEEQVEQLKQQATTDLPGTIEKLLSLEKTSRVEEDVVNTRICCLAILDVCFQSHNWNLLNEQIQLLAKRRGQMKQAIQAFVRQAMEYIDQTPNQDIQVELIKTLQSVTEGKIFVELERARLTKRLARIKEEDGKIVEAADILQEVAVETYGAMAKSEKIAFILEQVRLCMDKGDYVRAQILTKKISPKAFLERRGETAGEIGIEGTAIEAPDKDIPTLAELKMIYYYTLIRYHRKFGDYLEICRAYKAMYESQEIASDQSKWMPLLKKICWYLILAPQHSTDESASSDQLTLLNLTAADKNMMELPLHKKLLKTFTTKELVHWPAFRAEFDEAINEEQDLFSGAEGQLRLDDLKSRITEHNLLVLSVYYTRMHMKRLSELLDLTLDETETQLSDLVVKKAINAKIDRPSGIVAFGNALQSEGILNHWVFNISRLLDLVEKSCQQIQKESMQYKVTIGSG
eukprot:g1776.t1